MNLNRTFVAAALALTAALPAITLADDAAATAALERAQASFVERKDPAQLESAIQFAAQAKSAAQDADLKYEALILLARAQYFKGVKATTDNMKKTVFEAAMNTADEAIRLDKAELGDTYAEGYYFKAISLGRWAEANGILSSLARKDELMAMVRTAATKITRAGDEGQTIDGYGPNRILGRVYFKLPGFAGGDDALALQNLKVAVEKAPTLALNVVYYAEVIAKRGQKAQASELLTNLVKQDPRTFNPDRIPETELEQEDARKVLQDL